MNRSYTKEQRRIALQVYKRTQSVTKTVRIPFCLLTRNRDGHAVNNSSFFIHVASRCPRKDKANAPVR